MNNFKKIIVKIILTSVLMLCIFSAAEGGGFCRRRGPAERGATGCGTACCGRPRPEPTGTPPPQGAGAADV